MNISERIYVIITLLLISLYISCSTDPTSPDKKENTRPSAFFTIEPDSGDMATTFVFNAASTSDREDSTSLLKIRWNWNNDSLWDTDYSKTKIVSHRFENHGVKRVLMEVLDSGGLLDTATNFVYVSVINTAPVASFVINPDSGNTNTDFQFDASSSHDDQDSLYFLQIRWDWQNDKIWDTNYSTIKIAKHQFTDSGLKHIAMEVKDSGGLCDTVVNQLYVAHINTPPKALFTIDPDSGDTNDIFEFNASASFDYEDSLADLQIRWDWQNDGIWDTNFSTTKITHHNFGNEGIKAIALEVKDTGGLSDTIINQLKVSIPNTPPRAEFALSLTGGTTSTIFKVDASNSWDDEDSTLINVRWDWESDGIWDTDYSIEKTATHRYDQEGEKTIKLEVKDSGGLSSFATHQVNISDVPFTDTTVTDIDGNVYKIVKIGEQYWMAENLKVTHYRNSDEIPKVTNNTDWQQLAEGGYCAYGNNDDLAAVYGYLYNWYTVDDERNICPDGWHIPSEAEWQTLIDYLGGSQVAGGKLKVVGTSLWKSPNSGATNESGFSALPGASRSRKGKFYDLGYVAYFWIMSTQYSGELSKSVSYNVPYVSQSVMFKGDGLSIRCIKD